MDPLTRLGPDLVVDLESGLLGRSRESTSDTRRHARHEDAVAELLPAALDEGYGVTWRCPKARNSA